MRQKPIKQLISDCSPVDQPQGTIRHGKNGIQNHTVGSVINEPGFSISSAQIPFDVNGIIETDTKPIILSTNDVNSAIGFFDPELDQYTPILDDRELDFEIGFKRENYITGEYQKNNKNEYVIAFTDKNLPPMYLNCNDPQVSKLEDLYFFIQAKMPTVEASLEQGGTLSIGSYKAYVKLSKDDGNATTFIANSGYVVNSADGSGSVRVRLSGVDPSYDFVSVAFLRRIGGVTTAIELDPVPVSQVMDILYTGMETSLDITVEELLIPWKTYKKVGTLGQLNDTIYFGNLTEEEEILYQSYANNIKVAWESKLFDMNLPQPEIKSGTMRGFAHEEVYALYIRLRMKDGSKTKAFHVPGRAPLPSDLQEVSQGDLKAKNFQLNDTIISYNFYVGEGETGYWENDTEVYPDNPQFAALSGQKVRHHKMPSMRFIQREMSKRTYPPDLVARYGKGVSDMIGLKFQNVVIPPELENKVAGYEMLYAKRTPNNITTFGQSLVMYNAIHEDLVGAYNSATAGSGGSFENIASHIINKNLIPTGGPWNSNSAASKTAELVTESLRLYPFESLAYRPFLPAKSMYLSINWATVNRNQVSEAGTSRVFDEFDPLFHDYSNSAKTTISSSQALTVGLADINYIKSGENHNAFNGINNIYGEDAIVAVTAKQRLQPAFIGSNTLTIIGGDRFASTQEASYFVTLKVLKTTLYSSFLSQILVETDQVSPLVDTPFCYKGDVYLSKHTVHSYGANGFVDINTPFLGFEEQEKSGIRVIRNLVVESTANLNNRYLIDGDLQSEWQQHAGSTDYAKEFNIYKDPNKVGYNKDLNPLSESVGGIYNPSSGQVVKFPYRIHRGGKMAREGEARNWRKFLALDYYDMPKNMGEVMNLQGLDDALLIHMENALFVTQDKTKLESSDALSVTLGTADIFQFVPQEALSSKLGLAGTKHDLACVLTPMGYMFVDGGSGQVYLFKKGLNLLNAGLNKFLRDYAKLDHVNPYAGNGITIGYDPDYNRVLLTVKNREPKLEADQRILSNYEETPEFFAKLVPGKSIVYKDGRWQKYVGVQ